MKKELRDHNNKFLAVVNEMKKTKLDATRRYGAGCWNSLGARGLFADLNRKYFRVKHLVWEGNDLKTSETIEDTLMDMAVYSLLMIMSLRDENTKVSSKRPSTTPRPK